MTTKLFEKFTDDAKTVGKMASSLAKRGKQWDADAHVALVSALMVYGVSWNWTSLIQVLDAFPKSARRKAAIAWVETFASLKYREKENKFDQPKKADKRFIDVDNAIDKPFYDLTAEEDIKKHDLTLEQLLAMVKRKAKKATEDGAFSVSDLKSVEHQVIDAFEKGVAEAAVTIEEAKQEADAIAKADEPAEQVEIDAAAMAQSMMTPEQVQANA